MKKSLILSFFCLFFFVSGLPTFGADDPARTNTDIALSGTMLRDVVTYSGEKSDWTIYVRPGIRFSDRDRTVGYLDFLVPLYSTDKSLLFFNPKASFDDRDNVEWNVGIGYRHLLLNDKMILGGNVFYDGRKSWTGYDYHQIGVGAELLTEWVNARLNGYISLSGAKEVDRWREYYFGPTSLNYSWAYRIEEPLSGLDYEVGFKIPGLSKYLETWVYGGGYTYFADYTDDMVGWGGRIEVIPTDFLKLNFAVKDDNLRGTEYSGEVTVEVPFSIENLVAGKNPFAGIGTRFGGSRTMNERLYEQVRRDVDIVIEDTDYTRETAPDKVLPGDPSSFTPVTFVSPSGTGDGSRENPTSITAALAGASSGEIVFVNEGNYNLGSYLSIPDGVTLLGQGYDPYGIGYELIEPVLTAPALNPLGWGGGWFLAAYHVGNNAALMGFTLHNTSNAGNNAVVGSFSTTGALISHNTIENNGNGVVLYGTTNCSVIGNTITLDSSSGLSTNNYGVLLYSDTNNVTISGNYISTRFYHSTNAYADTSGIMFSWYTPLVNGATITNNIMDIRRMVSNTPYTTGGAITGCAYGIIFTFAESRNVVVSGNTINLSNGWQNFGIYSYDMTNADIFNNSFSVVVPAQTGISTGILLGGVTINVNEHDNMFNGF